MKTVKYSIAIIVLLAAASIFASNTDVASNTDDTYGYKFISKKLYDGTTELWKYEVYKNDELFKKLKVYVKAGLNDALIYVEFNYNSTWNVYKMNDDSSVENFWDTYRLKKYSVTSLKQAVNMAVDHYIQDQIANK